MRIRLEFKIEDMWVGAYWRRGIGTLDVWVCLLPCLPLHITLGQPLLTMEAWAAPVDGISVEEWLALRERLIREYALGGDDGGG